MESLDTKTFGLQDYVFGKTTPQGSGVNVWIKLARFRELLMEKRGKDDLLCASQRVQCFDNRRSDSRAFQFDLRSDFPVCESEDLF
jgi:hypothetical protein